MSTIYIYPKNEINFTISHNPYIFNFEKSLMKTHTIINNSINKNGVLDFFKYLFVSDIFLLNWIEDLPLRRHGRLQIIVFLVFLFSVKILRKKLVWFLHNKYSHDIRNNGWSNLMFFLMMKHSHLIITHSSSGIDFAKKYYPKFHSKVKYLIHPVQEVIPPIPNLKKEYDILIWGVILPYKGIVQFLKFIKDSNKSSLIKILIVGSCPDREYKKQLSKYLTNNIIHLDDFYTIDEISKFANQSRFILFTYRSDSVLSSGSLMDSIRMGSNIIGPYIGAFKDLSKYGLMKTYKTYDEIIDILENEESDLNPYSNEIKNFCFENSWDFFIEKFNIELLNICKDQD